MIDIIECEQGGPEWFQARMGIPTASEFKTILRVKGKDTDGTSKTRRQYMYKLACEIAFGSYDPNERPYRNDDMDRGVEQEDDARWFYEFTFHQKLKRVGLIINRNYKAGCSPDGLVGKKGGLEIKCALRHVQVGRLEHENELPPEHKAQIQGNLLVTEREWWDYMSYCPGMKPVWLRCYRDEPYLKVLEQSVHQFNSELEEVVERLKGRVNTKESAKWPEDTRVPDKG